MAAEPSTSPASPTDPEPGLRAGWQRWVNFWFPASDPTTLAFVRVTTGLLVLYIHLADNEDARYAPLALEWIRQMGMHDDQLERFLTVLKGGSLATEGETLFYQNRTPGFLFAGSPAERAQLADEIRAFYSTLPKPQL